VHASDLHRVAVADLDRQAVDRGGAHFDLGSVLKGRDARATSRAHGSRRAKAARHWRFDTNRPPFGGCVPV
jgi:hypothetical protein